MPTGEHPIPSTSEEVVVHVFGRTDVGKMREHNEDAFVVADLTANNATLQIRSDRRDHPPYANVRIERLP